MVVVKRVSTVIWDTVVKIRETASVSQNTLKKYWPHRIANMKVAHYLSAFSKAVLVRKLVQCPFLSPMIHSIIPINPPSKLNRSFKVRENTPCNKWERTPTAINKWERTPPAINEWERTPPAINEWKRTPPAINEWERTPPAMNEWERTPPAMIKWERTPPCNE